MIIVNCYTCPIYEKESYSIHIIKRNKHEASYQDLNKSTFKLILSKLFKSDNTVIFNQVKSKKDLTFNQTTVLNLVK